MRRWISLFAEYSSSGSARHMASNSACSWGLGPRPSACTKNISARLRWKSSESAATLAHSTTLATGFPKTAACGSFHPGT